MNQDGSELSRAAQAAVIFREIVLPVILVFAISVALSRWQSGLAWLNHHRPPYSKASRVSLLPHVQAQMLNLEVASADASSDCVLVVGSSSVVNGVDAQRITATWRNRGVPARLVNFGVTGLMSYELPMIARHLLGARPRAVVYLYNTFSFGDQIHRDAVGVRWDTREAISSLTFDALRVIGIEGLCDAVLGEALMLFRLRLAFKSVLCDLLRFDLAPNDLAFDLAPGSIPRPKIRPRVALTPIPPGDPQFWHRASYQESANGRDTIGWRGLRRFADLAREAKVPVLVAPVPEPEFAIFGRYKAGITDEAVDRAAAEHCRAAGLRWLSRDWCRVMQADDTLFRDDAHVHDVGRDILSDSLAELLPRSLGLTGAPQGIGGAP